MSTGALSTPEEVKDVKVDPAAASEWSLTVLRVPSLPVSEQVPTCQLDVCGLPWLQLDEKMQSIKGEVDHAFRSALQECMGLQEQQALRVAPQPQQLVAPQPQQLVALRQQAVVDLHRQAPTQQQEQGRPPSTLPGKFDAPLARLAPAVSTWALMGLLQRACTHV